MTATLITRLNAGYERIDRIIQEEPVSEWDGIFTDLLREFEQGTDAIVAALMDEEAA